MPSSPDTVPFTLSESDAHMAHQNTQQVAESIVQALAQLLKLLLEERGDKDVPPKDKERVISLPELDELPEIEPVDIQQETLQLEGVEPHLLNAAPAYQLEGQEPLLLSAGSVERQSAEASYVAIRIQVGETAVIGYIEEAGSDLAEALVQQLTPEQLNQLQQAVEQSDRADDAIDVESETVTVDGYIEDEQGQVEYLSLVNQELEAEQMPLDSTYRGGVEPYLQDQSEIVPPWEAQPEAIHTELFSVEQVESLTGNDFSNSPHLDDVGPVIAQVDDRGRILDKGYVQQQVESRVEDAEVEDEIDEQRADALEEPRPETRSPTAADYRATATVGTLLDTIDADYFEGDRYTIERQGNLTSVTATDGRGLLLSMEGENILQTYLEPRDIEQLQQGSEVLAQYASDKAQPAIALLSQELPSLDLALESVGGSLELD